MIPLRVTKVLGSVEGPCSRCQGRATMMLPCPIVDGRIEAPAGDRWADVLCEKCRREDDAQAHDQAKARRAQRAWLRKAVALEDNLLVKSKSKEKPGGHPA